MKDAKSKTKGSGISWKFILAFLVFAGIVVLIMYLSGAFESKDSKAGTVAPRSTIEKGQIYSLSRQSRMVPKEVLESGASRAVPMTDAARKVIFEQYTPSMVGVPETGEPFRMSLPRPMPEDVMKKVMEAVREPGQEIVFIKTQDPEVLFGFMARITGDMEAYCDKSGEDCKPVDVFYNLN